MLCNSCNVTIPSEWAATIARNICPNCNEPIISEENKKIMEDLRDAITKMSATPEELVGWLISTYDMRPKNTVTPTNFYRKPGTNPSSSLDGAAVKWANTPTNQFMKRAGADKILNDPKMVAMQKMIQNINSVEDQMNDVSDLDLDPELEEMSDDKQEMLKQQQMTFLAAKAKAQGRKLTMKDVLSNSTEFNLGEDVKPLSEEETEVVKHLIGGASSDSDIEELQNLPPILQADRLKRLAAQRELTFGGSTGKIKRY